MSTLVQVLVGIASSVVATGVIALVRVVLRLVRLMETLVELLESQRPRLRVVNHDSERTRW